MKKIAIGDLQLWQFELFGKEPGIRHFVTDRKAYHGEREFTLSYSSSPDREEVRINRHRVAAAMGIADEHIFFPSQVHLTRIVHVTRNTSKNELMETDALITREKGLCIAVMSADCVPILLVDRKNKAVAAIHSGWRGTVAKILTKTLHEMHSTFGTEGKDIAAAIGPSVSQDSYEVGQEVVEAFRNAFDNGSALMIPQPEGKAKLDLWKANEIQLLEFGVPASQIEITDLCSVKNNNYFFSARKGDSGRFAAGIMLT